jgi:Protein of unknown function (DUF3800)
LPLRVKSAYCLAAERAIRTPRQSTIEFAEWASLFAGKIFVDLVVYVDESGTHDRAGLLPGSEAPSFGGYVGDVAEWMLFRWHWQSVLDKYNVPYFHCREFFSRRDSELNPESHYYNWGELRRDTFLFELAAVAGQQVPIGSMFNLKDYVASGDTDDPYPVLFDAFFTGVQHMIDLHWPNSNDKVSFFCDTNKSDWVKCFKDVFNAWKIKQPRFSTNAFVDDKEYIPLQSADLITYRVRKGAYQHTKTRVGLVGCSLDEILFRNRDPRPNKIRDIAGFRRMAADFARQSRDEKFAIKLPTPLSGALT